MNTQQLDQEIAVAANTLNDRMLKVQATLAATGELNATELAKRLGVSPTTMRETLKKMVDSEEVVRDGNLYRLPYAEDEAEVTVTLPLPEPDETVTLPATATTTTVAGDRNAEAHKRDQSVLAILGILGAPESGSAGATLEELAHALDVDVKTAYGSIWRLTHRENGESPKVAIIGRLGRKPLWGLAGVAADLAQAAEVRSEQD